MEIDGNEVSAVTIDKSSSQKINIVVRPVNYDNILGEEVNFVLTADSISPGDGSATLSASIIMEIPLDKISDLSVSLDDVLINGKPHAILTESDVKASEPVQIQLTVFNKGGQSTGSFTVKLYEGSRVIDEYNLVQGVSGFGSEFVILQWENPSSGSNTSPVPEIIKLFSLSPIAINASNLLKYLSVLQSLANSTAALVRFPACFSNLDSNLSKRVNASAVDPANPAITFLFSIFLTLLAVLLITAVSYTHLTLPTQA